jgi:hypothetical protein
VRAGDEGAVVGEGWADCECRGLDGCCGDAGARY